MNEFTSVHKHKRERMLFKPSSNTESSSNQAHKYLHNTVSGAVCSLLGISLALGGAQGCPSLWSVCPCGWAAPLWGVQSSWDEGSVWGPSHTVCSGSGRAGRGSSGRASIPAALGSSSWQQWGAGQGLGVIWDASHLVAPLCLVAPGAIVPHGSRCCWGLRSLQNTLWKFKVSFLHHQRITGLAWGADGGDLP